jgi:hypothetical protein
MNAVVRSRGWYPGIGLAVLWLAAVAVTIVRGFDVVIYPRGRSVHLPGFAWMGVTIMAVLMLVHAGIVWLPYRTTTVLPSVGRATSALLIAVMILAISFSLIGTHMSQLLMVWPVYAAAVTALAGGVWCVVFVRGAVLWLRNKRIGAA